MPHARPCSRGARRLALPPPCGISTRHQAMLRTENHDDGFVSTVRVSRRIESDLMYDGRHI
jgi:hypothetical protein